MDKAVSNSERCAGQETHLDSQMDAVMEAFFEAMSGIGEPSVDSATANIAISMVAGCVMYTVLQKMGLGKRKSQLRCRRCRTLRCWPEESN